MRTVFITLCLLFGVYTALVYGSGQGKNDEPADATIRSGMSTWQEQNCQSCHQLYGLGGYMGPDLTNTFTSKGGPRIRTFIRYGTGRMPSHALNETEIEGLVAFLGWVASTGTSKVPPEAVHWSGTYMIEPH
mgnify:CR=1 FL=1